MALELKISQKLSQTLVMTPQLQQAIKLLQLGRQEYLEVIEKELLENPILDDSGSEDGEADRADTNGTTDPAAAAVTSNDTAVGEVQRIEQGMAPASTENEADPNSNDTRWDMDAADHLDLHGDSARWEGVRKRARGDDNGPTLEASVSAQEGLDTHLFWQLRTSDIPEEDRPIAVHIIGNIDRNGYLSCSVEEIAEAVEKPVELVAKVLRLVQEFDPAGIAARDLRECLLIQLDQQGQANSLAAKIVSDHLGALEIRRYDGIAKAENVPVEEVYSAVKMIQTLEPRPGRPFADEQPVYITPDVHVRKIGTEYVVSLNESGLPRLRLNPMYREYLDQARQYNSPDKEYLQERVRSAMWLIKSIHQRQQTILRVTESIMKFQRTFLENGVSALRPLVLRDVAEDVSMHESTVSRVTTNKFVHTPWGVFELKYFFSSGIKSGNTEVSSESVKERIRDLIAEEDVKKPLSDQALVNMLRSEGIDIARRTVAKYREMMGILSSSRRKQLF